MITAFFIRFVSFVAGISTPLSLSVAVSVQLAIPFSSVPPIKNHIFFSVPPNVFSENEFDHTDVSTSLLVGKSGSVFGSALKYTSVISGDSVSTVIVNILSVFLLPVESIILGTSNPLVIAEINVVFSESTTLNASVFSPSLSNLYSQEPLVFLLSAF